MKRTVAWGLAMALGLACTLPATAQYGNSPGAASSLSVYQPTAYGGGGYPLQEGAAPAAPNAPNLNNVPLPGNQLQVAPPQVHAGQPHAGQPHAGQMGGPVGPGCGNGCGQTFGNSVVDGGAIGGVAAGASCYQGDLAPASSSNWIVGVYGLGFSRDYEDDIGLSQNPSGDYLFSTDADLNLFGGVETMIGRRNCNGKGWEMSYFGLFPGQADTTLTGVSVATALTGLASVTDPTSGFDAYDIFNNANNHRVYRDNEFHNFEWNILRNAGSTCNSNFEWLAGFRWFEFDEFFRYATFTGAAGYPTSYFYDLHTQNTLLGFQLGGRRDFCISNRMRLHLGAKAGLFNNRIRQRQQIFDQNGTYGQINNGPFNGRDYDYSGNKNDVAMLGELDLGMSYLVKDCWRIRGGYRAIGVSGVALAPDQIPLNFANGADIQRVDSNGSLILHGFYVGAEFCF